MTTLTIEQGSSTETVSNAVIQKLYNIASNSTNVTLTGNLQCECCYQYVYDYFTGNVAENVRRFPNLSLTVTNGRYINFADPEITKYWADSTYGDGVGLNANSAPSISTFPKRLTENGRSIWANAIMDGDISTEWLRNGCYAFYNDKTVTSFNELGQFSNITTIPTSMFRGSTLKYIDLSNIINIEAGAFAGADLTGVVNLPKFKQWRGRSVSTRVNMDRLYFASNPNMTEIHIGADVPDEDKITSVHDYTFLNCSSLSEVTGLNMVTSINTSAFKGCSNLSDTDIDWSKILYIGTESFRGCTNLSSIENISIPNLTLLEKNAFRECTQIKTISNLGLIEVINDGTFTGCTQLTSISYPSTLRSLWCLAFEDCDMLTIIGPEGLEKMVLAQYNNKNRDFKYVEVPSTVIDMDRFFHRSLNKQSSNDSAVCVIKAINPPTLGYCVTGSGGTTYDPNTSGAATDGPGLGVSKFLGIYVPDNSLNDYLAASGAWQEPEVQAKLKPISQLETDDPSSWTIYQQGLSNS